MIQATPPTVNRFVEGGIVQSGGGLSPFVSGVVRSALDLGLQETYLRELRTLYAARIVAMDAVLRRELPEWIHFATPAGGYFYWLQLPDGLDANDLLANAAAHNVGFRPGNKFSAVDGLRNYIRLSFSYYDSTELVKGVALAGCGGGEGGTVDSGRVDSGQWDSDQ
ncbi:MAG: hypothetical protein R2932_13180 [Caldilineaceae bacterium]